MISGFIKERCHYQPYLTKVCSPSDCIRFFKDGQLIGWSGFGPTGEPKAVPIALANYVQENHLQGKMRFNLFVGASASDHNEDLWAKNDMIASRFPFTQAPHTRKAINIGKIKFADRHLSLFPEDLAWGFYSKGHQHPIDVAIVEASEILDDGSIVPGAAVGSIVEICHSADKIIIEINKKFPSLKGIHDLLPPWTPPGYPYNIRHVNDRIGRNSIKVDPSKIVAIVESDFLYTGNEIRKTSKNSLKISQHIIDFLMNEVKQGRLPPHLNPIQSGVGSIANAVLDGLHEAPFHDLTVYTEVLQDSLLPMFDSGKLKFASSTSFTLFKWDHFFNHFETYRHKVLLRQQSIANSGEVIRRLGVIAMDTPVEVDMYGHANSTLVGGTRLINGIGGSGDYMRNAYLSIMHCPSVRRTKIDPTGVSCIVPMCSHIDHTEHDIDVIATEQGLADLRGLCPIDRARLIIRNCAHPSYKDQLTEYLNMAIKECQSKGRGHEPQILDKAFKMELSLAKNQTMHLDNW